MPVNNDASKKCTLLIHGAAELVTAAVGAGGPKRGDQLRDIGIVKDGAVAVGPDGRIIAVGSSEEVRSRVAVDEDTVIIDAAGKTVLPGFVDPHTHIVHGGAREFELGMRLAGRTYIDILNEGGGILNTVKQTQGASVEELTAQAAARLRRMVAMGTTTVESKSGYGLTTEAELRQLQVNARLARSQPVRIVSTFMGAHAIPVQYKDDPDRFVDIVVEEMIPAVAAWNARDEVQSVAAGAARGAGTRSGSGFGNGIGSGSGNGPGGGSDNSPGSGAPVPPALWGLRAEFNDIFCEKGVFTPEQSRRVLEAGRAAGMEPKIHAEEIVNYGGAALAAELGAVSADHLVYASEDDIEKMAAAGVVAVLLPATTLFLMGDQYAPARAMIDAGVPVALATDCNPGSSPTESMALVIALACLQLRMLPAEAVAAATINAAYAVGKGADIGSLEPGKLGDIVVLDAPSHQWIAYKPGVNLVERVIVGGRVVVDRSTS